MKLRVNDEALLKTASALAMICVAGALRIAPHPWNLAPVGAIALFSGAVLHNRWMALAFPLLALFAGDAFIGFHKLMPVVYASFVVSVAIGMLLREKRTVPRVAMAILAGSVQFFIVTNFAVWLAFDTYPRTLTGLAACYAAGIPFFWNTLASDALYSALLFGGFALAEKLLTRTQQAAVRP